jgi:hypothetical protein
MDISVIIPTFNGKELLKQSLPSLFAALPSEIAAEVLVVDNHSDDGTEEFIASTYPHVVYIPLSQNYGFTRAINEGAHKAHGRTLLLLNNDCFLNTESIEQLYAFLHENHQHVATQPIVYTPRNTIEHIGYIVDKRIGKAFPIRNQKELPSKKQLHDEAFTQDFLYGLSATCLCIRRDVFMDVGMFDDTFHSYLEDIDLFFRLKKKGYQWYPETKATCIHAHRATSNKMGSYKERRDLVNWMRIIAKHYPREYLLKYGGGLALERLRNGSGLVKKMVQLNRS